MIPRKHRKRYIINAEKISKELNINIDLNNWEDIWSLLDKYSEPEYLYAIQESNTDHVKIGKSKQPWARMHQLQSGFANKLYLLAYCPHISPFTEKESHKFLKESHVSGEWFKLDEKTSNFIDLMIRDLNR